MVLAPESDTPTPSQFYDKIYDRKQEKIRDNSLTILNTAEKKQISQFQINDLVEIISDLELAKAVQAGHGEWVSKLS